MDNYESYFSANAGSPAIITHDAICERCLMKALNTSLPPSLLSLRIPACPLHNSFREFWSLVRDNRHSHNWVATCIITLSPGSWIVMVRVKCKWWNWLDGSIGVPNWKVVGGSQNIYLVQWKAGHEQGWANPCLLNVLAICPWSFVSSAAACKSLVNAFAFLCFYFCYFQIWCLWHYHTVLCVIVSHSCVFCNLLFKWFM